MLAAPACATIAYMEVPKLASDPSCVSGEYKVWLNTSSNILKKCENGAITAMAPNGFQGGDAGPGGNQYDPDRPPSSANEQTACSDEFDASSSGTWTSRNFGTATITTPSGADYAVLTSVNQSNIRARTCAISNAADWTMTIKFTAFNGNGASGDYAGLIFVETGTCAAPTNTWEVAINRNNTASDFGNIGLQSTISGYSLPGGVSTSSSTGGMAMPSTIPYCLQARYVSSTKVMTMRGSGDCRNWGTWTTTTHTFSSAPACAGFFVAAGNTTSTSTMKIQWIRTRTDAAGTSGEYLVGQ